MVRSDDWIYQPLVEPIIFDRRLLFVDHGVLLAIVDGSALTFWDLVIAGNSHNEAISALAERFGRSQEEIEADFRPLIDRWLALGLIDKELIEPAELTEPVFDCVLQIGELPVRIRLHVSDLADKICALYRPALSLSPREPVACLDFAQDENGYYVARDGRIVLRAEDQGLARGGLLVELLRLSVPDRFWIACLHASAIGNGGRCLVFSGDCGAGKTTLTLAMIHAGHRLVADDMLPLDRDDRLIWPLPFAMSLKPGTVEVGRAMFEQIAGLPDLETNRGPVRYFFPEDRAHRCSDGGLAAAALIFPRFEADADLVFEPLDRAEALKRLSANGSALDLTGYHLRDTLAWLEDLPCYSLRYGNLDEAVGRLSDVWTELCR